MSVDDHLLILTIQEWRDIMHDYHLTLINVSVYHNAAIPGF